jgi:3-oxoadipate enol-lactonase
MPRIQCHGIELYYETHGSGEPLLLIAGFGCDHLFWSQLVPVFAPQHQVIVFDNRGVGQSAAPDGPCSIRQMADDSAALLDAIGVGKVHVAGQSMGGLIAQELTLARPQQVRSLTLISSCAKCDERGKAIIETWGELAGTVEPRMMARLLMPWLYTHAFYAKPGAVEQWMTALLENPFPASPQGLYHQSRAISSSDTVDRLGAIRCPTLVLVGQEDILLPVAFSEQLAQGIPTAELIVLENTGHGLLVETPEAVAKAMREFLASHSRK